MAASTAPTGTRAAAGPTGSGSVPTRSGAAGPSQWSLARPSNLDLFVLGSDGGVYSAYWNASGGWADWFRIGTDAFGSGGTVTVVARTPDNLDLFVLGSDGGVYSAYWNASGGWADWFRIGTDAFGSGGTVTVVARTPDNLDLFVLGSDGGVYSAYWNASGGWADWFRIGTDAFGSGGTVTVVARTPDNLDLFVLGSDGGVYSAYWNPSGGWADWFRIGFEAFIVVHFKSLLPIAPELNSFIDREFAALEQLFGQFEIRVFRATTEDLSGVASLAHLVDLDIEEGWFGGPTKEQEELYANRNNAAADDIVIYIVRSLQGHGGQVAGNHAAGGRPAAAIVQTAAAFGIGHPEWNLAHEVGHVLGLDHVSTTPSTNSRFLMWPNDLWTNPPPDLSSDEVSKMLESPFTRACSPDRSGW